jgi:hypothetical protein
LKINNLNYFHSSRYFEITTETQTNNNTKYTTEIFNTKLLKQVKEIREKVFGEAEKKLISQWYLLHMKNMDYFGNQFLILATISLLIAFLPFKRLYVFKHRSSFTVKQWGLQAIPLFKHLSVLDVIQVDVAFMPHNHLPKVLQVALSGGNLLVFTAICITG